MSISHCFHNSALHQFLISVLLLVLFNFNGQSALAMDHCSGEKYRWFSLRDELPLFCCNGTQVSTKKRIVSFSESNTYYFPCIDQFHAAKITSPVELQWNIEACVFFKKLGITKAEELTYRKFAEFAAKDYTSVNNVKSTIIESNVQCPVAMRETDMYKKYRAMHYCFYDNVEKQCTSSKSLEEIIHLNKEKNTNYSSGCTRAPGIFNQFTYCCQNETLPEALNLPFITNSLRLGKKNDEQFLKCLNGMFDNNVQSLCVDACALNPIIFNFKKAMPTINWKRNESISLIMKTIPNPAVQKEMIGIYENFRKNVKLPMTQQQIKAKTGIPLDKALNAWEKKFKTISAAEQVELYCGYYETLATVVTGTFFQYCHNPKIREMLLALQFLF